MGGNGGGRINGGGTAGGVTVSVVSGCNMEIVVESSVSVWGTGTMGDCGSSGTL